MSNNKVISLSAMSFLGPEIDYFHIHGHRDLFKKILIPLRKSKIELPLEISPLVIKKKVKQKRYEAFFKTLCPLHGIGPKASLELFTEGNQLNKDVLREVQSIRFLLDDEKEALEKDHNNRRKGLYDFCVMHEDIFSTKSLMAADIANGIMLIRILLTDEEIPKDIAKDYFEHFEGLANNNFSSFEEFATHAEIAKRLQIKYLEYKHGYSLLHKRELTTAMFGIYSYMDW